MKRKKISYRKAGVSGLSVWTNGTNVGHIKVLKGQYVYVDKKTGLPVEGIRDQNLRMVKILIENHLTVSGGLDTK